MATPRRRANWPRLPIPPLPGGEVDDHSTAAYTAEIELAKDVVKRERDQAKEEADRVWEAFEADDKIEGALLQDFHQSVRAVAKSNAERVAAIAETVQKAAAAVIGIYTALLAVLFAVGEVGVPPRAILPALFLGVSVVLSTAYVAWIRKTPDQELRVAQGPPRAKAVTQTANFIRWSRRQYLSRAHYVRGSVVSLALGLLFLPAPLLTTGDAPAASIPNAPAWPEAQGSSEADIVLYTAQVEEVARLRASAFAPPPPLNIWVEGVIWVLAITGGMVVIAVTWSPDLRDDLEDP